MIPVQYVLASRCSSAGERLVTPDDAIPTAAPAPQPVAPVGPGERILTLDVLRGIALFGVLAEAVA
jgi:hypothetical protein